MKFSTASRRPAIPGHSLSVSDVVKTEDGFFYCDFYEFKPIEFDESQSKGMEVIDDPVMME